MDFGDTAHPPQAVWDKAGADGTGIGEIGPGNLTRNLDPIWPEDCPHVSVDQVRDWFATPVYLPRLRDDATLDGALQRLVEDMASPYAYASGFDEETCAYDGVIDGKAMLPGSLAEGFLVRREAVPTEDPACFR